MRVGRGEPGSSGIYLGISSTPAPQEGVRTPQAIRWLLVGEIKALCGFWVRACGFPVQGTLCPWARKCAEGTAGPRAGSRLGWPTSGLFCRLSFSGHSGALRSPLSTQVSCRLTSHFPVPGVPPPPSLLTTHPGRPGLGCRAPPPEPHIGGADCALGAGAPRSLQKQLCPGLLDGTSGHCHSVHSLCSCLQCRPLLARPLVSGFWPRTWWGAANMTLGLSPVPPSGSDNRRGCC